MQAKSLLVLAKTIELRPQWTSLRLQSSSRYSFLFYRTSPLNAVSEAEAKAAEILKNAEEEKARKMQEADSYWEQLSSRLEAFYQSHPGLKEAITDRFGEIHK